MLDFGAAGVSAWMNHATWQQVSANAANQLAIADLDNDGIGEVVLSQPASGLWTYQSNRNPQLRQLSPSPVGLMAICADMGRSGSRFSLAVTFPGAGTWFAEGLSWTQIHPVTATLLNCAKTEAALSHFAGPMGQVIAGFGASGLWSYRAIVTSYGIHGQPQVGYEWKLVHPFNVRHMAVGNFDGRATDDLIVDFGAPWGLWTYANDNSWSQLVPYASESVTFADIDGISGDEVLVDFGPPFGLYAYSHQTGWRVVHDWLIYGVSASVLH